ncbi:MAG: hypothetical protein MUF87_20890 [Anaerolineae bacterium]|jgi:hypothetical protein|nr:hypothetical protein [Anaerolineae bacterium]
MQNLNRVWQLVNAASSVRDLTQQHKTYHFKVAPPITFYLQTEHAEIRVSRWMQPEVEVTVKLTASFGWRVVADQDEAGVYVAAKRRPVIGAVGSASFEVMLPSDTYVILRLAGCSLRLDDLSGEIHVPPNATDGRLAIGGGSG